MELLVEGAVGVEAAAGVDPGVAEAVSESATGFGRQSGSATHTAWVRMAAAISDSGLTKPPMRASASRSIPDTANRGTGRHG